MRYERRQIGHREDFHPLDQRRLVSVRRRDEHAAESRILGERRHGQDAVRVQNVAVERELPDEHGIIRRAFELPGAVEQRHRQRQVVGGAGFADIRRREVGGDALHGEFAAGVSDGGANPRPRLLNRRIRQADDVESGQSGGYVHLDLHDEPIQTHNRARPRLRQQPLSPALESRRHLGAARPF